jgi:hypothetical protein
VFDLLCVVKYLSIVKMENYGGTKHTGIPVKTLKKILKKAGLKVSGKKATLTRRAKRAKLFGGLGRAPQSKVSSLLSPKAIFENSPEQQQLRKDLENRELNKNLAIERGTNATNEMVREQARKEGLNLDNVGQSNPVGKAIKNIFTGLPSGGKKKRSRRS